MAQKSQKYVPPPRLVCIELNPGPGRGHQWSEEQKWSIITLWKHEGKSLHAIATELGVDRRNVKKLIEKYKETGTVERRSGQGRKRKLTRKIVGQMRRKAKQGKSAPQLARRYNQKHEEEGQTISEWTVRTELKGTGLKYLVVEEKEELTPKQISDRLAYAKKRVKFDWRPVLFTDEKTFPVGTQQLQRDLISCF